RLTDRHKTIPYFKRVLVSSDTWGRSTYRPDVGAADLGDDWPGGFFCPCHGSKFDLAGRVFRNVPAPLNLEIPPHAYQGETRLVIGQDRNGTG
ncbi:Rieske 2Fe-2S domain-containing protein, partial [Cupriavidus gilardii]